MPNLFVDGKWTTGTGGTADVLNPFDASVVEAVDQAGPDDVDAAVAAARSAFDDPRGWRATSVGLITHVQPAASAGASFHDSWSNG